MSEFTLKIHADGAAFTVDPGREIGRILRKIAVEGVVTGTRNLLDINGNTVGEYTLTIDGGHHGTLQSGEVTCTCGWTSGHFAHAEDSTRAWDQHLRDEGVT